MIEIRLRSKIGDEELESKKGKIVTDLDYNLLVTRDCTIRRPDGSLMAVFRKAVIPQAELDAAYPVLHELRKMKTDNRGLASGTKRFIRPTTGRRRTGSKNVASAIIGSFEKGPTGNEQFCRLTAWTGQEFDKFTTLHPLLGLIGDHMRAEVTDRWEAQMRKVQQTDPAWVIGGTPFTTVTVNNTYPTGVHTDKGDLDEGFSNLLVMRNGITGGRLVWPQYRVAVEPSDGDLLLMDAHEWHGNTEIRCAACGENLARYHECGDGHVAERISVVAYYRTKMTRCGTASSEAEKVRVYAEQRSAAAVGE